MPPGRSSCVHLDKAVHRGLVAVDRAEQLLHLRWWGFERRQLAGEFVHQSHVLVARALIVAHGVGNERVPVNAWSAAVANNPASRNASCDPLCCNRIFVVAGISDERPTRTLRLAEDIRHRRTVRVAPRWRRRTSGRPPRRRDGRARSRPRHSSHGPVCQRPVRPQSRPPLR